MKAYSELLGLFPEESQGQGTEPTFPGSQHQPMTYGLVLSAEALHCNNSPNDESRRRVRKATRWLLDNRDLDGDGQPGWGLPQAWDAFDNGVVNPANHPYTITTSIVLNGLLDALSIPSFWTDAEREEIRGIVAQTVLRWCRDLWCEGFGGGFFWYSPEKADAVFGINAPAMFLGSMVRFLGEHGDALQADERRLIQERADNLAKAMVATVMLRQGAPYWDYVPAPNIFKHQWPNDVVHHVYTLWGIEVYRDCGGRVRLPWTRAQAIESVDRFWRDGRICRFPQDTTYSQKVYSKPDAEIRNMPTRLWSAAGMLAFYGKWGTAQQASQALDAIDRDYGPWPKLRLRPRGSTEEKDDSFYPRHGAHVLWGLALHCFGS